MMKQNARQYAPGMREWAVRARLFAHMRRGNHNTLGAPPRPPRRQAVRTPRHDGGIVPTHGCHGEAA